MKLLWQLVFLLGIALYPIEINAQVEGAKNIHSLWGIETGGGTLFGYYEHNFMNAFSTRGEVGYGITGWSGSNLDHGAYITIQPRYYYNIDKRVKNGKKTLGNSADFMAFDFTYRRNNLNYYAYPELMFVPSWGMRRTLGKCFSFECFLGVALYRRIDIYDKWEVLPFIKFRFGTWWA